MWFKNKEKKIEKTYIWRPKEDITVYELAQLVPYFHGVNRIDKKYETLPFNVKRHIEVVERNND